MTFRATISSKGDPKRFLRRGLHSMFPNYPDPGPEPATPPVDTESERKRKAD